MSVAIASWHCRPSHSLCTQRLGAQCGCQRLARACYRCRQPLPRVAVLTFAPPYGSVCLFIGPLHLRHLLRACTHRVAALYASCVVVVSSVAMSGSHHDNLLCRKLPYRFLPRPPSLHSQQLGRHLNQLQQK